MTVPMLRQTGAPSIASPEIDDLLRRFAPKVEADPGDFRRGVIAAEFAPSPAERSALDARHAELVRSLDGHDAQARAHVTMMRNAFRSYGETAEDAELNLMTWMLVVGDQPVWAIRETVRRFIRAGVRGADDRRGPTPAEFSRVLSTITAPVHREIRSLETVLRARVEAPIDPAAQARARAKAAELISGIVAARVVGRPEPATV
ncbi:UNVERIFIED_ORG: hypothetical protein M2438_002516 [Methylobacterium sp. SuP10 SLI 274]|uniref:hypothetical protein n=1 Tax=Methylorubrum extorquens TaxID=408 RepID=UPI0020A1CA79|nr:hypothetical protein [Methylorubrum extorquens]MDF9863741.1 hypothetical protein [Methylorubrum pseudosasae]MDH6637341.1 hypothetical protein [Methylobacterium sp. SuP10 SLI 274]MDH6666521.1 hypothetical protein [Methylorubrum zatmanii]MCP1558432.1 hypothetical protein [Methylorubrum extorquens]MDF9792052.1 hypothetical protein [Methylorubrum extorquens]